MMAERNWYDQCDMDRCSRHSSFGSDYCSTHQRAIMQEDINDEQ